MKDRLPRALTTLQTQAKAALDMLVVFSEKIAAKRL